ncbi:hypothetical protein M5689_016667 [Euphorbia peplus]|nr:hypothetical protein M5689_016667 [Euphorbia peplus]
MRYQYLECKCKCPFDHLPPPPLTEDQLKRFFQHCDKNGDNRLSWHELEKAFDQLGSAVPAWRAYIALIRVDKNGDGYININQQDLEELVKYAFGHNYRLL